MSPWSLRARNALFFAIAVALVELSVTGLRNRSFPEAPPHDFVAPKLDALPPISACWLELMRNEAPGFAGTAGFTKTHDWHVTVSGLLIRHPKGDVLLDVGNSSHFEEELADYPLLPKLWLEGGPGQNVRVAMPDAALRSVGADPKSLRILLSHGHVDHAGGIIDLPDVPVLLAQDELDFMRAHVDQKTIDVIPAHARALEGRADPLVFTKTPYENFDESDDLFGDGSVVIVKLPGHTPGSIGTFVNLSPTQRLFQVGDAVNLSEQIERRIGKSFVMYVSDADPVAANRMVSKLAQLEAHEPSLKILPAHDRDAWQAAFGGSPRCIGPR